jgi:hypothetical protein
MVYPKKPGTARERASVGSLGSITCSSCGDSIDMLALAEHVCGMSYPDHQHTLSLTCKMQSANKVLRKIQPQRSKQQEAGSSKYLHFFPLQVFSAGVK